MKRPVVNLSLRNKMIIMFATTLILATVVNGFLIRRLVFQNILKNEQTTAEILTSSIVHDIQYSLDGRGSIQSVIAKYMTYYRIIKRISYYDADGRDVADSERVTIGERTTDAAIIAALDQAKPSYQLATREWEALRIRSISPILKGSSIVGAVVMEVSIDDIKQTIAAIDLRIIAIVLLSVVPMSIVLFFMLRRIFLIRLRRLMLHTQDVASGNYEATVVDEQKDELGKLAAAFNHMTADLRRSQQEIDQYNKHLEQAVERATANANKAYEDLKNAQSQLILNEKMASLGVLIAGIAHEINTPVGAILNVSRNLDAKIRSLPPILEQLAGERSLSVDTMVACLEDIIDSASRSERMPSYQQTRAIEAIFKEHGIENHREKATSLARLNFTDPDRIRKYVDCLAVTAFLDFAESIGSIVQASRVSETSSQKISEIVRALRYYAYSDSAKVQVIQINESIQNALVLLRNQLKDLATVRLDLADDIPSITCTSEIHQIWTNLLTNSLDAITAMGPDHDGEIVVRTTHENGRIEVTVTDNGVGIPEEHRDKIYDPFFTTKDIGAGTGLGLSIVSGIVKKHHGSVRVESRRGNTCFHVSLPVESMATETGDRERRDPSGEHANILRKTA